VDKRTGERHDYTRRSGVESVSWFAPAGCREQTSAELWNRAEAAEKRRNATVAREVLVALPHELNQVQRLELVQRMTQQLAERYGVAGTAAIHAPDREGDQRNWHTHILMTTRQIDPATGELGAKTRELDDMKTGPKEVLWIRQMVEREGNAALERAGHAARLDCRSLAAQGVDREPTTHEGPRVTAIRRECAQKQRGPLGACDVIELNDVRRLPPLAELRAEAQQLEAEIIDLDQYRLKREIKQLSVPAPHPPMYSTAVELVKRQREAVQGAKRWRTEHPVVARVLDAIGIRTPADREVDRMRGALQGSSAVQETIAWQRAEREREQRLEDARRQLEQLLGRLPPSQIHAESPPPEPQPEVSRAQRSLAAGLAAMEQWKAEPAGAASEPEPEPEPEPDWIEWEQDGEQFGQWEGEQQVYWLDEQQGEWLLAEDRPQPEPERYSGPRMG